MGVNSLPKTVTRQSRGCDLNPGPTVPESSTLNTRLPSHPRICIELWNPITGYRGDVSSSSSSSSICTHNYETEQAITYHFGWFVLPLIDEVLKRLLHHVDKLLVLVETNRNDVVQFVFEVYRTHSNSSGTVQFIASATFNSNQSDTVVQIRAEVEITVSVIWLTEVM